MGLERKWYAVYTTPRAEKQVSLRLTQQNITHYLPLQKVLKQWSDRKKWVEEPLFKSYLFVYIDESQYYRTLNTAGVVKFITFGKKAVAVPDYQIDTIRLLLMESQEFEISHEALEPGMPVEVIAGPLLGTIGELISLRGEKRVAIKIQTLETSVLISIAEQFVGPLKDPRKLELLESIRTPKFVGRTRELG